MAFRFDRLTLKSQEAVQTAQSLARDRSHQRLEPMHLLAALLDPEQQVIRSLLAQLGVNPTQVLKAAEEGLNVLPKVTGGEQSLGPDLSTVLDTAQTEADRMKDQYVSVEHLLLGPGQGQEQGPAATGCPWLERERNPSGIAKGPRRADRDRPESR